MNKKYINVNVTVVDAEGKFEENKDVKCNVNYSSDTGEMVATTGVTKKVDRSPNLSIFESEQFALAVKIIKDGRISPSGRITPKKVKEIGSVAVHEEFKKAADAVCEHCGV